MLARILTIERGFVAPLLLVGCFGLAHVAVEMPPLIVQGVILTLAGDPWPDQLLTIALSDFYARPETFEAITAGETSAEAYGYEFCEVRSGAGGEFFCLLPGESRYIGFMPPLMCPSERTLRSFVVAVRTSPGVVMAITVSGTESEIRVPSGADFELVRADSLPFNVSTTVNRSGQTDVLQLVMRAREPAVQQVVEDDTGTP